MLKMRTKITPFSEADIEEASELLARRHEGDRAHEPALPERFTQPAQARIELERTWKASTVNGVSAGGVVARHEGKMVGYLIGVPRMNEAWGRSVWVEYAGHAIDRSSSAELYRDLYAALSPTWVALGCLYHVANLPASDRDALDAWFDLSFGKEHSYGLRETAPASSFDVPRDPTLSIRRATPADVDLSVALDDVISRHNSRAPVYAIIIPYNREEARQEALEQLENAEWKTWLALRNGQVVGIYSSIPARRPQGLGMMVIPDHCSYLGFAATREEEQGRGIGRALTAHGLADDFATGYAFCFTDWRATNLLASRMWLGQGWRPIAYRLTRRLDERILWSHAHASPAPWLDRRFAS
jgi:ribosomal protein S18 acetylase RimI-like enzyme